MKSTALRIALATTFAISAFGASAASEAAASSAAVGHPEDYKVFIDAPTGYAFVKTPSRWVFTRKIDSDRIAESSAAKRVEKADAAPAR
ncbi:hypothetical protein [Methyloversatilis thermotolerans]|uniref:hypothetical protein n=1 Tax=Methyloversatilis thermotolerans TaxID=1346290 RepID=UPI000378E52F|nr:hypothetical protein [Methyloversatilis thermotolerans]